MTLTVVILTFNEQRHIARCIESVHEISDRVIVVDSYSTDETVAIAKDKGCDVFEHTFVNHASQLNWGLDSAGIQTDWVMRLDADEVVTPELRQLLQLKLPSLPGSATGVTVNRMIQFLGQPIRHGGIYPARILRVWRNGCGRCEDRWMDEHIIVTGDVVHLDADIVDDNLNNLTWWTQKHNDYANREAIEILLTGRLDAESESEERLSHQAKGKRWLKESVYSKLPLGLRSFVYFFLRYFVFLGFLDGRRGAMFHFLQGFWYRFLVDCKVYELKRLMRKRGHSLEQVARDEFGFEL